MLFTCHALVCSANFTALRVVVRARDEGVDLERWVDGSGDHYRGGESSGGKNADSEDDG